MKWEKAVRMWGEYKILSVVKECQHRRYTSLKYTSAVEILIASKEVLYKRE